MPYITREDLAGAVGGEDKLVQLTDDSGAGEVDWTVVDKAISYATGKFNSYARTKYTLPVPATEMVQQTCLDLAVFQLQRRRATTDEGVYKVRRAAHDDAIKFMADLQAGKAALDVPAAEETKTNPTSSDTILKGGSRPSAFSDDKLRNF
jgi:phage gp36-like protein